MTKRLAEYLQGCRQGELVRLHCAYGKGLWYEVVVLFDRVEIDEEDGLPVCVWWNTDDERASSRLRASGWGYVEGEEMDLVEE